MTRGEGSPLPRVSLPRSGIRLARGQTDRSATGRERQDVLQLGQAAIALDPEDADGALQRVPGVEIAAVDTQGFVLAPNPMIAAIELSSTRVPSRLTRKLEMSPD